MSARPEKGTPEYRKGQLIMTSVYRSLTQSERAELVALLLGPKPPEGAESEPAR